MHKNLQACLLRMFECLNSYIHQARASSSPSMVAAQLSFHAIFHLQSRRRTEGRFPVFSVDGCVSVALWGMASVVLTQALSSCKTQTWELCNLSSRAFYVDFIAILCNQNTMTCIACGILYALRCTWDKAFPLL